MIGAIRSGRFRLLSAFVVLLGVAIYLWFRIMTADVSRPDSIRAGSSSRSGPVRQLISTLPATPTNDSPGASTAGEKLQRPVARLSLKGIMAGDGNKTQSRAIIEADTAGAEVYRVGDKLPGGESIDEILPDRVILLSDSGHFRTLRLEGGVETNAVLATETVSKGRQMIEVLRRAVVQGPEKVLAILDAKPILRSGRQIGYQVWPPETPAFLDMLGLEPGDVVTDIDGISLASAEQLGSALGGLWRSDRFEVTIRRNGVVEKLMMGMPDAF